MFPKGNIRFNRVSGKKEPVVRAPIGPGFSSFFPGVLEILILPVKFFSFVVLETMRFAFSRSKRSYRKRPFRRSAKRYTRKSGAYSLARKALSLARKTKDATVVRKYFTRVYDQDVAQTALVSDVTSIANYTQIFAPAGSSTNNSGIVGNHFTMKRLKFFFDFHMDNANNEEETCNFTVALVAPTKHFDEAISGSIVEAGLWYNTGAGQCVFDTRYLRVLRQKYFSLTMGGTSPGTAGESRKYFKWNLPWNKKVVKINSRMIGATSFTTPASVQDRIYLVVISDNTTVDTESPRMNATVLMEIEDQDQQIGAF